MVKRKYLFLPDSTHRLEWKKPFLVGVACAGLPMRDLVKAYSSQSVLQDTDDGICHFG
jgi:hypothetical protein